jgi:hypothetical protein
MLEPAQPRDPAHHVLPADHSGIVLKGIGLAELWPDVWPLVAFGAVIFTLAVLRFRKSLD